MIKPAFDYLLCEAIKKETGAVTPSDVADHWQRYKVLAAGTGRHSEQTGQLIPMPCKVGDTIYVQKHAEADSPDELKANDQYLIMASRVMAVE